MSKEINIRDPLRYLTKGAEIVRAFKEEAGLTIYRAIALMELYSRELSRQELKENVGIKNEGQFSSSVLGYLRARNYITPARADENIAITEEGKTLVEKVLKELKY